MFKRREAHEKGLKIIIVGCGKVGRTLVQRLSSEGHNITIIDQKASRLEVITNLYDVMAVEGNGASYTLLKEAGVEEADLMISVTNSDELNLLCCTLATQAGKCAAIARVRTPDYSNEVGYLREKLGLAMVLNPELQAAREMARILYLPSSLEVNSFAHDQAELVKFEISKNSPLNGLLIRDLPRKIGVSTLIGAVERNGEVYIPSGLFTLESGDIPCLVADQQKAREFLSRIGEKARIVRDTLIVGGGRAAFYLADELLRAGVRVKIIEIDRDRCEELSVLLPGAVIINGDGCDKNLLLEEGIADAEGFVALTGIDEENIILTLFAKEVSHAKVITKINRIEFTEVIAHMDLGSVIYPKDMAAETIQGYVRARKASINSNVETLYHMYDQRVEAIEFMVKETSAITGTPLKDLKLKDNLLVSAIFRDGQAFIPSGQDSIHVGDTVMVITTHTGLNDILDVMA